MESAIPPHVAPEQVFEFDMHADPRVTDDVHGSTAAILAAAPPVFYTPCNGGHWVVRGLQAIGDILQDYEHFSSREMHIPRLGDNHPVFIPLSLDPAQSMPYRLALMPAFSVKNVRALEPTIRGWATRIVAAATEGQACDFVRDVASLYPVSVFMELMGLPLERLREFRALTNAFFSATDPQENERLAGEILGILAALIEQRREDPREDLASHLLAVEVEGRRLSTDEVLAMSFLLFIAGMDTVTNLTGFAFRQLASDPALQTRLGAHPELIPQFVEEALRSFPVVNPSRLVIQDCDRYGVRMRAGDMVLCLLAESGFEAQLDPDPGRFHIDRDRITHLTFGSGPHLCLGHILARTEIRILTEEWLRRVPRFAAKPGDPPDFRMGVVSAIESLPLTWETGRAAA